MTTPTRSPLRWIALLLSLAASLPAVANERIVSIGGDVTEIVAALGAGDQLVARDSTSLKPASVTALPDIGYMRQLNAEGILAMKPTLVISSELAEPSLVLQQVQESGVNVVRVPGTTTLDAVTVKISVIANALGRKAEGEKLAADFTARLNNVAITPVPVKVLFIMSHGGATALVAGQNTAADSIIQAAGATNAMQGFSRYRPLSQEGVIAAAPDLLLLSDSGIKSLGGVDQIWNLPGMAMTPAARNKRMLIVDDMSLLGFGLETPEVLMTLRQALEQVK
ncbi:heme/hemin ABC transporter substrate-binding protein [Edaphovirga cremea]|uniref:heme/hemin ABC transporter substrate-binding protein n=1 Tax=Edaphovirga cremea TaxID=2267246 RepID=UPI000DF0049F|nr:ABC transporter substrate-binding protein [Edaphovirga cremea]